MLLRLLPAATPNQPNPPTILFTLPLPSHPYTARSLPLPANLLAHRSVCLQEEIECSNVLLGEKSSWIGGAVDDVTFSLPTNTISTHMIDGTCLTMPIDPVCAIQLERVVHEVRLSFAPPPPTARTSTSSLASTSSTSSGNSAYGGIQIPQSKRTPSGLLYSLLSPLLPGQASRAASPPRRPEAEISPARIHRRQARSILVDTYRRHVLPDLKDRLSQAYLPWIIASETNKRLDEFDLLRGEINAILAVSKVDHRFLGAPLQRCSSRNSSDESDSESDCNPYTPASSVSSTQSGCTTPQSTRRSSPSPQSFLLSIPPPHALPVEHREAYSARLVALSRIASRLAAIKRLGTKYEREEGKRRWLESLERGKAGDRALRRAYSNGELPLNTAAHMSSRPNRPSRLVMSWTIEDEENKPVHPAMSSDSELEVEASSVESISDAESESELDEMEMSDRAALTTPPTPVTHERPTLVIPESSLVMGEESMLLGSEAQMEGEFLMVKEKSMNKHTNLVIRVTPPDSLIMGYKDDSSSLMSSKSDESIEDDWEIETRSSDSSDSCESDESQTPVTPTIPRSLLPTPKIQQKSTFGYDDMSFEDLEIDVY
ncbi:hypothetical protein TREMEDRAFT_73656 [Tremella mesenterica DSM 1558]|uniref:uncharacterized protein n=1 Tax=Tremella mesenterica (strain ATCC 24925 / CBS 8224 / DSM 1558 / NBRC 9311 / NRRL Y-6157 / RJB 2259-6 / UBC 559-6) TaxID=578456 RepID=UPI0003F48C74|nr:uncharacterized protein TREMEDRAFT_73656 [Tremella mesenterica DSM 1558]EIW69904.1 hypothetical protein TREMEDRAFT_73656 [Tremella mesenterica DSM 1558]